QQHFEVSEHLFAAQQYARAWRHQVYSGRCALDLNQYHLAHDSLLRALEFLKRRPDINEQLTSAERFDARRAHVDACIRMNLLDDAEAGIARLADDVDNDEWRLGWLSLLSGELENRRGQVETASEGFRRALE